MIDIESALAALSLEEKCFLVAGETNWRTRAVPHAGIPQLKMTDGPTGVRGEGHGSSGTPGVAVPAGITLGASWNPDLLAEIGDLLGRETVRKRAHVLLGPTVNLHRTPIGGRTFECYSEDPELSAVLATSYVRAVQENDVAVTVKHFACNDTEIDRLTVDAEVDEVTLREIYLRPFERAVTEGGAWGIMSAYNRVNGDHAAENRFLLTEVLREEWGFDGFVVSDWFGAHEPVGAANAGLSLEMPAPARVYGDRLLAAIDRGDVTEETIDGLVRDLLVIMNRTRADERSCDLDEQSVDDPTERSLTRRAAVEGTVLLRNAVGSSDRPVLPIDSSTVTSVAVIGPNAVVDRSMGGGSASLTPFGHRTLLEAVTDRLAAEAPDVAVSYHPGVRIDRLTPIVRRARLRTPSGEPGLRLEYVNGEDWDAPTTVETTATSSMLRFFGTTPDEIDPLSFGARVTGSYIPEIDGPHVFGVTATGPMVVTVTQEGEATTVVDDPEMRLPRTREFFGYGSEEQTVVIECVAGRPVEIDAKWRTGSRTGFAALRIGVREPDPDDLLEQAVAAAAAADVALVVVGTNDEWETEGFDREVMSLPGRQDELVERVVSANPDTVVVINAGSPVTMDWAGDDHPLPAPSVLTSFFAGQEQAEAMVDVLLGVSDPGGRLPTTYPQRLDDTPAAAHYEPVRSGENPPRQPYLEGMFVGYRHYEARAVTPRFWFGHGLSYGAATWGELRLSKGEAPFTVEVPLNNTGDREVTVVVQGYVAPVDVPPDRPARELATWSKVRLAPGDQTTAALTFGPDAFRRWDAESHKWTTPTGPVDLVIAHSADPAAEHGRLRVELN